MLDGFVGVTFLMAPLLSKTPCFTRLQIIKSGCNVVGDLKKKSKFSVESEGHIMEVFFRLAFFSGDILKRRVVVETSSEQKSK